MRSITTVSVEILRHGPPHNQLLSPLTQYLARTGAHATTLSFPYEHHEFLHRLAQLRYRHDDTKEDVHEDLRRTTINELGRVIGEILAKLDVFLLIAKETTPFIHIELELSAAELAMIPFELSDMPEGGGGMRAPRLALQTRVPVSITRRIRGATAPSAKWPVAPRVLFAWSNGTQGVPVREHRKVLRDALGRWDDPWEKGGHFRELRNVSLARLTKVIEKGLYTHVHLLAHGAESDRRGQDYALELNREAKRDEFEVVDASRLTSALCLLDHRPTVVCLAACDSGNVGSIHDRTGASVAHSLHQAGVPLVVASQFPLEEKGSVVLARELFEGLFAAEDPRVVLHNIRTALHRHDANTHDWASVVAYSAFPTDLQERLEDSRYWLARIADNQASKAASERVPEWKAWEQAIESYPNSGRYAAEGMGMRGSAYKRLARVKFDRAMLTRGDKTERANLMQGSVRYLERARDYYAEGARIFMTPSGGMQTMASLHWVLTQQLGIRAVLGQTMGPALWWASWTNARAHEERNKGDDRVWAYANQAELCLLQLALPADRRVQGSHDGLIEDSWPERARYFAMRMFDVEPPESWRIRATRNAFKRFTKIWWAHPGFVGHLQAHRMERAHNWTERNGLVHTAQQLVIDLERPPISKPSSSSSNSRKPAKKTRRGKKGVVRKKDA